MLFKLVERALYGYSSWWKGLTPVNHHRKRFLFSVSKNPHKFVQYSTSVLLIVIVCVLFMNVLVFFVMVMVLFGRVVCVCYETVYFICILFMIMFWWLGYC